MSATAAKPLTRSTSNFSASAVTRAASADGIGDFFQRHDEGIEIVVVVLLFGVVAGAAVGDIVLGADAKPEQQLLIDLAVGDGDHLDAARQRLGDRRLRPGEAGGIDEIASC